MREKHSIKAALWITVIAFAFIGGLIAVVGIPTYRYLRAGSALRKGDYNQAIELYDGLGTFMDAPTKGVEARYEKAQALMDEGRYGEAAACLSEIGEYMDAPELIRESAYGLAENLRNGKHYEEAISAFESLGDYTPEGEEKSAKVQMIECMILQADVLYGRKDYDGALELLDRVGVYGDSENIRAKVGVAKAGRLAAVGKPEEALDLLETITGAYNGKDPMMEIDISKVSAENTEAAAKAVQDVAYLLAGNYLQVNDFAKAAACLKKCPGYKDSDMLLAGAENAFDRVYWAPYADGSGNTSKIAASYLWVHSLVLPGAEEIELQLLEDFCTVAYDKKNGLPAFFGAGTRKFTQNTQENDYIFTFSYELSKNDSEQNREILLVAGFSPDYTLMNTKKIFGDTAEDIEFTSSRNWQQVKSEDLAEAVREGFRSRLALDLARTGNLMFADCTNDPQVGHTCSVRGCVNPGSLCAGDAAERSYYCQEHEAEYRADPKNTGSAQ